MHIFNARSEWSAPRRVELKRRDTGYGFSVIGSAPVIIQSVEHEGSAKVRVSLVFRGANLFKISLCDFIFHGKISKVVK